METIETNDLIYAIATLTKIVQPFDNKISYQTQNKAQSILTELIIDLECRFVGKL